MVVGFAPVELVLALVTPSIRAVSRGGGGVGRVACPLTCVGARVSRASPLAVLGVVGAGVRWPCRRCGSCVSAVLYRRWVSRGDLLDVPMGVVTRSCSMWRLTRGGCSVGVSYWRPRWRSVTREVRVSCIDAQDGVCRVCVTLVGPRNGVGRRLRLPCRAAVFAMVRVRW